MAKCEICKLSLRDGEGFVLGASQMADSSKFWEGRFTEAVLGMRRKFGNRVPKVEADKKFKLFILQECHKDTGRLVCSGCLTEFEGIDREKAAGYAKEFWKAENKDNYKNKDTGCASVEDAVKVAGPIWKRMTGHEPPQVEDNVKPEKKKGCFIATACYGDYNCREVKVLRRFRDEVLEKSLFGSVMVKFYYGVSPTLAGFIEKVQVLKKFVRFGILEKIVEVCSEYLRK